MTIGSLEHLETTMSNVSNNLSNCRKKLVLIKQKNEIGININQQAYKNKEIDAMINEIDQQIHEIGNYINPTIEDDIEELEEEEDDDD